MTKPGEYAHNVAHCYGMWSPKFCSTKITQGWDAQVQAVADNEQAGVEAMRRRARGP